ncbi:MAG TPA: LysR substrate-binding domain-containing protein [Acidobacteriaceae bacterium]|jgi:DNA-binding transcriptional LysR family regulator|nr:LysR substrate-binding domain-containing protein [Acidobacteriaceae bacterium]
MIHDLRHIRAFLAAARIGNFTRAALELHISQSAFTVQIRQLEDALGVTLFDRSKRRVALTSAARDLLVPLERLIIDSEAIVSRTQQLAGLRRGIVNVAVLPSVAAQLLPQVIQRFVQMHPGIVVQINDVVAEKLIEAVKKEQVDFGIGSRVRVDREIRTTPLLGDRLCAFVPRAHLLARQPAIALKELISFPLILTGKDSSVRELLERALRRERLPLTVAYETNYMSTAVSMVRAGLGIAVLPEFVAGSADSGIRCLTINKPVLSRRIEIIQRKDRSLSPAAARMVEVLREVAANPS